jgi:hypothetical protein
VQPLVTVRANGASRAEVAAGQPVRFTGSIEVPPGTGYVVGAEWDFEGSGDYPVTSPVPDKQTRATVSATYSFSQPGTHFVTLRGYSQRSGDKTTPFARLKNLARARVVVK